ncbi:helix-turn-helix domain-containing protein [Nocardia sp. NPDC003482]
MTVVLDTDTLDPGDRVDALVTLTEESSAPSHVRFDNPESVRGRYEIWQLGDATVYRSQLRDMHIVRTARQVKDSPAAVLTLILQQGGRGFYEQHGNPSVGDPGRFVVVDLNNPYQIHWGGDCRALALQVPVEPLCLPSDTLRRALLCVPSSPLHSVVADYLAALVDSLDDMPVGPAQAALGDACTEMVRALLLSAIGSEPDGASLPDTVLLTRIRRYVLEHLSDAELSPERIARAQHISVRHLYKLCSRSGFSLEQWIIGKRLERARAELARLDIGHRSIATVGRICGFRDPSHFARRFRAAYGLSPSEWRRSALTEP